MTFLTIPNILPKETGFMNKDKDWHKKSKYGPGFRQLLASKNIQFDAKLTMFVPK